MIPYIYKISANGNTFLIFETQHKLHDKITESERALFAYLVHAHNCDSFLLTTLTKDFITMRVFEKDCSESDMCGNGIRALAYHYGKKYGFHEIQVLTKQGPFRGKNYQNNQSSALLFITKELPSIIFEQTLFDLVHVGEPHAIHFCNNIDEQTKLTAQLLKKVKNNPYLFYHAEQQYNLNIAYVDSENNVHVRTIERGVNDETRSCGTGSTATIHSYYKKKKEALPLIHTKGGTFRIHRVNNLAYELIGTIDFYHSLFLPKHHEYSQNTSGIHTIV